MVKNYKNRIEETNKHNKFNTKRFIPNTTILIEMDVINILWIWIKIQLKKINKKVKKKKSIYIIMIQ